MQLLAHMTSYEFAVGIVFFVAGFCSGCCMAHIVFARIKRRWS
jgi:hypothetical protein